MSCYEWERGTIKLPTKIFAKFRREYINKYNNIKQQQMDKLNAWRELVLKSGKGKRNYDFKEAMFYYADNNSDYEMVEELFPDGRKKPLKPTRKMFNFVNGKTFSFDVDGGCSGIGFSTAKEHSVSWVVHENNHAVESARATPEAYAFFNMLRGVNWTGGSGGVLVGNNEYNRDDEYEGGGANYVTATYGNQK